MGLCHRGGKTMSAEMSVKVSAEVSALTAQNGGLICPAMSMLFSGFSPAKRRRRRPTARMRARA
jgi:hypothetical protein